MLRGGNSGGGKISPILDLMTDFADVLMSGDDGQADEYMCQRLSKAGAGPASGSFW